MRSELENLIAVSNWTILQTPTLDEPHSLTRGRGPGDNRRRLSYDGRCL